MTWSLPQRSTLAATLRILLTALVALPVIVHGAAYSFEICTWRFGRGAEEIRAHCGSCHEASRVRDFARSPGGWRRTVGSMARGRGPTGVVDSRARDAMVGWLVRYRSADGATLVRHRCGRCHDQDAFEPYRALGDEALATLITQHVRQQNHAIQAWEGEAIVEHLCSGDAVATPAIDPARSREFQRDCGVCHTPTFLYRTMCEAKRETVAWEAVVTRMRGKSPELFGADRIGRLARHSAVVCDPPLADR